MVLAAALLIHFTGQAGTLIACSDFDASCLDGWVGTNLKGGIETLVCVDDAEFGGQFISIRESKKDNRRSVFQAPAKFLGNQEAVYGGYLQYRLRQIHTDQMSHGADVRLCGAGLEIDHDYEYMPTTDWDWHYVPLDVTGRWRLAGTQQYVEEAIIRSVLRELDRLLIRAEFSTRQKEQTDLDDVQWVAPGPSAPPCLSITRLPDGRIDVTWPIVYDTYLPESSPTGQAGSWQDLPPQQIAGMVDDLWHARFQPSAGHTFIRLRQR